MFSWRELKRKNTKVPLNSIHKKAVMHLAGAKPESSNLVARIEKPSKYGQLHRTGDS